jgi:hypothetical protein
MPRMAGVTDRVEDHFRLFNDAVRRDWTAFLATFTSDAVMRFNDASYAAVVSKLPRKDRPAPA